MFGENALNELEFNDYVTTFSYSISDTFLISDGISKLYPSNLADTFLLAGAFSTSFVQGSQSFSSTFSLEDNVALVILQKLDDLFSFQDSAEIGTIILAIADTIELLDQSDWSSQKILEFVSTVNLVDESYLRYRVDFSSAMLFTDSVLVNLQYRIELLDQLAFADTISNTAIFIGAFQDSFSVGDSIEWNIQNLLKISDTISLLGAIKIASERYLVWGVNPRTAGTFKWTFGEELNSFAVIGGKSLVCTKNGIFEAKGGLDDSAMLRTGFVSFDDPERHYPGEKLKQLLNAYLVMTAEGETLLKVKTTRRGVMEETWFKCREKPEVMSKTQIPLSNSLRSVLFQFELKPLEKKPMKVNQVEIIPLFLSRSI